MTSIYSRHFLEERSHASRGTRAVLGIAASLQSWTGKARFWDWGLRVVAAWSVCGSLRYLAREVRGVSGVHAYRLRHGGRIVCVRHGTSDSFVLADVFARDECRVPPVLASRWANAPEGLGTVLDLGGHIGTFPLYVFSRHMGQGTRIVSFEPDPGNAAVLQECIARNALASQWSLVRACAGTERGTTRFVADWGWGSRMAEPGEDLPTVEVAVDDVFESIGEGVDLMKLDIEGGEWAIVADDRMRTSPIGAVMLEYHPEHFDQGGSPRERAIAALQAGGFELVDAFGGAEKGVVWAVR